MYSRSSTLLNKATYFISLCRVILLSNQNLMKKSGNNSRDSRKDRHMQYFSRLSQKLSSEIKFLSHTWETDGQLEKGGGAAQPILSTQIKCPASLDLSSFQQQYKRWTRPNIAMNRDNKVIKDPRGFWGKAVQSRKTKIVTIFNCPFLHPFKKRDSQNTESKYLSSALTLSIDNRRAISDSHVYE